MYPSRRPLPVYHHNMICYAGKNQRRKTSAGLLTNESDSVYLADDRRSGVAVNVDNFPQTQCGLKLQKDETVRAACQPLKVMGDHANITAPCRLFVPTSMLIIAAFAPPHSVTRLRGDIHHQRTQRRCVKLLFLAGQELWHRLSCRSHHLWRFSVEIAFHHHGALEVM